MSLKNRILDISLLLLIVGFFSTAFSQTATDSLRAARASALREMLGTIEGVAKESAQIFKTKEGYLRFVGAPPSTHFAVAPGTPQEAADAFLQKHCNLFVNVSPAVGFDNTRIKTRDGRSYVRYRQTYAGLEVFGAEVIVQVNAAGGIAAVMSDIMRDTQALDTGVVSLNPTIDDLTAQDKAVEFLGGQHKQLEFEASPATLMIFDPLVVGRKGEAQLVWEMEIVSVDEKPVAEFVLVDAHSGNIAFHYSLVFAAGNPNRRIYDYSEVGIDPWPPESPSGEPDRGEGGDETEIDDIDNAYDYLGDTYDFYWTNHERDSYDGEGADLIAAVLFVKEGGGAWWVNDEYFNWVDESYILICEGMVADDVVGHEFTHGVTFSESDLIYSGESGAITESFSDMWGEWIDQTYDHDDDDDSDGVKWYLCEDWVSEPWPWRRMNDPILCKTSSIYGDDFGDVPQPDRYNSDYYYREGSPYFPEYHGHDYHGVHHNLGVGNKLCYLLTDGNTFNEHTVWGMDISKTANLFYECQTGMIPKACDYYDLYHVITHAAKTLEMTWEERVNIEEACQAVEIANDPLVGWWKFDDGSGQTASDSSGYGNHGQLGSTPNPDENDPDWVEGKINGALDFDVDPGEEDYVSLPAIDALKGNTVTISAWIKGYSIEPESGIHPIVSTFYYEEPDDYYGYLLCVLDNEPRFYIASGSDNTWFVGSSELEIDDGWHHVAGTYDGFDLKIYVNGKGVTCEACEASGLTGYYEEYENTYIGRENGTPYHFDGIIDEVRIYKWAVDVDEILDKMFYGTSKFSIKNNSGVRVAWFDNLGNLFLKGELEQDSDFNPPTGHDEFRFQDSGGNVAIIDTSNGNMYIKETLKLDSDGDWVAPTEGDGNFRIKDSGGYDVAYISKSGYLYLKGKLYQQSP